MTTFKVHKNLGYTVISNYALRDIRLTLKAKGLLCQMLSLPDNWDFTLAGLSKINKENKDAIRSAIHELEYYGYLVRERERDDRGKLRGTVYDIYEQPQHASCLTIDNDKSEQDRPALKNPMQEKATQYNKDRSNKEELNKDNKGVDSAKHYQQPHTPKIQYEEIQNLYNRICNKSPKCEIMSDKRKRAIKTWIKNGWGIQEFERLFEKVSNSNFLTGGNDRNWVANIDWVLCSNNAIKILEGNYDARDCNGAPDDLNFLK